MNGIERITARILSEADSETGAQLEQARSEAAAILAASAKQAEQETEATLENGRRAAKELLERRTGVAVLEARKLELGVRQEKIDEAFAMALEKLWNLPDDEMAALLTGLAVKASRTGSEQIILNMSFRQRFGKKIVASANKQLEELGRPANLTLSEEIRPIGCGLILVDGRIELNCTFAAMLRAVRDEWAPDISKILFD